MRDKFYESLNSGFNNMMKTALKESKLLEKKVELSDEDKADDELIASAVDRKYRNNGALTKEEKNALKRHGYKLNGKRFVSPNGYIDANYGRETRTYTNDGRRYPRLKTETGSRCLNPEANFWDRKYEPVTLEKNFSPVNFSRRQKERIDNRIPVVNTPEFGYYEDDLSKEGKRWFKPVRGAKKNYSGRNEIAPEMNYYGRSYDSFKSVPYGRSNFRNRLDAERFEQNKNLQKNFVNLKGKLERRKKSMADREGVFERTEKDRQKYLDSIKYYKQLLAELNSREEEELAGFNSTIDNQTDNINNFLSDIKNKKK